MIKRKTWLILAVAILLLSNIVIFAKVMINRTVQVDGITLTERELKKPWRSIKENSGLVLNFQWQTIGAVTTSGDYYSLGSKQIKVSEQLRADLGFEYRVCRDKNNYQQRDRSQKKAWALFEMEGQVWQQELDQYETFLAESIQANKNFKSLEQQVENFERLQTKRSRLYLVELAADRQSLESKNTKQTFIAEVLVKDGYQCGELRVVSSNFDRVFVHASDLGLQEMPEHYELQLSIGKLGIPWIERLTERTYIEETSTVSRRCRNAQDPVQCLISSVFN